MAEAPRRVNYYYGMVLGVDDLTTEQKYHRTMRYLDNRLHGYGIVEGLQVTMDPACAHVSPGWAIDALGREVVVTAPLCVDLTAIAAGRNSARDLLLTWAENPDAKVPGPDGEDVFTRWVEQPELSLALPNQAPPEALVLARLTRRRSGAVSRDESMRRLLADSQAQPGPESQRGSRPRWMGRLCLVLTGVALGTIPRLLRPRRE